MGRILITNVEGYCNELDTVFGENGFKKNGEKKVSKCYTLTYGKLNVNTCNFFSYGEEGYVACSGTLIYKNRIGITALEAIAEDIFYSKMNVEEIRNNCIGSFALTYKNNESIVTFVDEVGSYSLHYYISNSNFLITNTSFHIEQCVKQSLNPFALCERAIEFGIVNGDSYFEQIYRLLGDEILEYCLTNNKITCRKVKNKRYKLSERSFKGIVNESADLLMNLFAKSRLITDLNQSIRIEQFATGGVDTRLFLGLYIANEQHPDISNWMGHLYLIDSKLEDRKISRILADKYGLRFNSYNLKRSLRDDKKYSLSNYEKYGEYGTIYGGSKGYYNIFTNNKSGYYEFGYFSDIFREHSVIEKLCYDHITLKNYVKSLLSRTGFCTRTIDRNLYDAFFDYVLKKYARIACDEGMDVNNLSRTDCKLLSMYYHYKADGMSCNFANMIGYAPAFFAQKTVRDLAAQIPYDFVRSDRFVLALLKKICPELLDVPFFTHCNCVKYLKNGNFISKVYNAKNFGNSAKDLYEKNISEVGIKDIKHKIEKSPLVHKFPELNMISSLESAYYMHMKEVLSIIECIEYSYTKNCLI